MHNERKGGTDFNFSHHSLCLYMQTDIIWEKEEHVILISITTHTVGDHGAICCSLRKSLLHFF